MVNVDNKLSLIITIVNSGYSEDVVNSLREKGAKGATILSGNGSVRPEAEKLYGIQIHPEKEILLITVATSLVDELLKVVYEKYGQTSEAQGVAFSLPIEDASENLYAQYDMKA